MRLGDRFLAADRIGRSRLGGLGPQVVAARAVDEMNRDSQLIARRSHAAGDQQRRFFAIRRRGLRSSRRDRQHAKRLDGGERVHDLVAQAAAEIIEAGARTVVGQRHHRHRVAADQRRGQRPLRGRRFFASRKTGAYPPFGRSTINLVAIALIAIIAGESRAQPPGLDANDRIGARIERGFLAEDLDPDHIFLEIAAAAADGLPDDEADEALEALDLREGLAAQDAGQLLADGLVRQLVRRKRRRARGHRPILAHSGVVAEVRRRRADHANACFATRRSRESHSRLSSTRHLVRCRSAAR